MKNESPFIGWSDPAVERNYYYATCYCGHCDADRQHRCLHNERGQYQECLTCRELRYRKEGDLTLDELVEAIRNKLANMQPSFDGRVSADYQRREVFDKIQEGYCKHCGTADPRGKCQCWNDD